MRQGRRLLLLGPPLRGSPIYDFRIPGLRDVRSTHVRSTLGWLRVVPSGLEHKQSRSNPFDGRKLNILNQFHHPQHPLAVFSESAELCGTRSVKC